jgi:competence protein ComEA
VKRLVRLVEAVRASAWVALVVRAALAGCAILVLAWVGASASSAAPSPAPSSQPDEAGAGRPTLETLDAAAAAPVPMVDLDAEAQRAAPHARATPDDPVLLNRASADDLRRLPGCGEKRAEAILALRRRLGRFTRVEELLRVKGVGRTTLKKWKPLVRID